MMYSSIVLYSGGIDSFILYEYVKRMIDPNTHPVYFNNISKYSKCEFNSMIKDDNVKNDLIIDSTIQLQDIETSTAFIPNRNILLTTLAVSRYSKKVFIGGSLSDRISDNNRECFDNLSKFLTGIDGKYVITITSPFWDVYKEDMVNWYCHNVDNGPYKLLHNTFSCYSPLLQEREVTIFNNGNEEKYNTYHCFSCAACFRRNVTLSTIKNNLIILPFIDEHIIEKYYNEFNQNIYLQETPRSSSTLFYVNKHHQYFRK